VYGIELRRSTKVGRRLLIGHQGGIVIHPQAEIGDDCTIRQNVTIGATTFQHVNDAPTLGSRVNIGAGAVILGRIHVGDDVRIGPNAVVTTDVPAGVAAFAPPARVMRWPPAPAAPANGAVGAAAPARAAQPEQPEPALARSTR
jgi:serine O-acetyltransferase